MKYTDGQLTVDSGELTVAKERALLVLRRSSRESAFDRSRKLTVAAERALPALWLSALYEMERACFSEPWSRAAIDSVVNNPASICVVEDYGYLLAMRIADECELYRIAVLPEFRGQGLAYSLMRRFFEKLTEYENMPVFLEVAAKNTAALKLYEKCGFVEINRRRGYYKDDDAVIMKRT